MVCNRDERRDRPDARPPIERRVRRRRALYPVDPVGGGTWIGVNDAGLAVALLNRTIDPARAVVRPVRSRGLIIPRLLGLGSFDRALMGMTLLNLRQFDLFHLMLVQGPDAAVLSSDGLALSVETMRVSWPLVLTSSSLGDAVVVRARRRLFRQLVRNGEDWLTGQNRFHAHRWKSRSDVSVLMERPDARTVSRTLLSVGRDGIEVRYDGLDSRPVVVRRL